MRDLIKLLVGFGGITLRGQSDPPGAKSPSGFGGDGGFWRDWEGGFVWGGRNGRELSAGLGIWRAELFWEGGFDSGGWLCLGRVVLACVFPGRACRCDVITLPVYINLAVFGLDC